MNLKKNIDHLVYCVFDLEAEINRLEHALGVRPVFGGYHSTQGTKNALLHLGNECYLELLAIDENNTSVEPPRWMGIDVLTTPKITRWALKSETLKDDSKVLEAYHQDLGYIQPGSRQLDGGDELIWQLTKPLASPEVEVAPFLIDWSQSKNHPCDQLSEACQLESFIVEHPNAKDIQLLFDELNVDVNIVQANNIAIKATIQGPKGSIDL